MSVVWETACALNRRGAIVKTSVALCLSWACCAWGMGVFHPDRDATAPAPPRAEGAGVAFDLQGFVDAKLQLGERRIVIPPGRYRVAPRRGVHLAFKNLHDVEIVATGVEMVCTQTTQALAFEGCRNVTVKGLAIDYDPLPFTEGRIVAQAPDKSWLEFELFEGYPDSKLEERIEIFSPATGELRRATLSGWQPFEKVGPRRYRVAKPQRHRFNAEADTEEIGDILVTNHVYAPDGSRAHAVFSSGCVDLKLEDIWLFASNCFGFLEVDCDHTTYLRCRIDRRPLAADYPARGFARMRSLDADAFHSKHAVRGPQLIGCAAKYQGDDCVNICGDYHMVLASQGAVLRVLAKREMNIAANDPVEFLPYEGCRPADAVALAIEPATPITEAEQAFVLKQRLDEGLRKHLVSGRAKVYTLTLDRGVAVAMGSLVCSGRRMGNGFLVKDCDFGYNRSRGILIKASRGGVIGNRITRSWMSAVLISPEFWWFEAASSSDIDIRNNRIDGCKGCAIAVEAHGGNGRVLPAGAHRNISICDNQITGSALPCMRVTSTAGLVIRGNTLTPARSDAKEDPVRLEQCESVER